MATCDVNQLSSAQNFIWLFVAYIIIAVCCFLLFALLPVLFFSIRRTRQSTWHLHSNITLPVNARRAHTQRRHANNSTGISKFFTIDIMVVVIQWWNMQSTLAPRTSARNAHTRQPVPKYENALWNTLAHLLVLRANKASEDE